jgi:hypothetical protein
MRAVCSPPIAAPCGDVLSLATCLAADPLGGAAKRGEVTTLRDEFAVPRLCNLRRSSAVLGRAEWALACRIDGRATVGELARQSGVALPDAIAGVTRLVTAGLCTLGTGAAPGHDDQPAAADVALPLPRRPREVGRVSAAAGTPVDFRLLQQVLNGLKSLD